MRANCLLVVAVAALSVAPNPAVAQQGTPVPTPMAAAATIPPASACDVTPRSDAELAALVEEAYAEEPVDSHPSGFADISSDTDGLLTITVDGKPWVSAGSLVDPGRQTPLSADITGELQHLLVVYAACENAANFPRIMEIFTDEGVVRVVARFRDGIPFEFRLSLISEPGPAPEGDQRAVVPRIHAGLAVSETKFLVIIDRIHTAGGDQILTSGNFPQDVELGFLTLTPEGLLFEAIVGGLERIVLPNATPVASPEFP